MNGNYGNIVGHSWDSSIRSLKQVMQTMLNNGTHEKQSTRNE